MSSPHGERDIVRLRTFADDFERAKSGNSYEPRKESATVETPEEVLPTAFTKQTAPEKKPITLKEEVETSLDAEGITFDQDVSKGVVDQAYEESQAIVKAENDPENEVLKIPEVEESVIFSAGSKQSILSSTDDSPRTVEEADRIGTGSIVRDTRHERFRLIPAIIKSAKDWFSETKEEYIEAHEEKFTVTKTQERVETIKAAAQQKTFAPDEDYKTVAERLKQTKRNPVRESTVAIKPKEEIPTPQWTHTDEPKNEKKATQEKPLKETEVKLGEAPKQPESVKIEPKPEPVKEVKAVNKAPIPAAPPVPPTAQRAPTPVIPKESKPKQKRESRETARSLKSLIPSPFVVLAVVLFATMLGIGTSFYFFGRSETSSQITTAPIRSLVATEGSVAISYTEDHTTLFNRILEVVTQNPQSVYVYLIGGSAGAEQQVDTKGMATTLAPSAPGSFTRSITNINFAGVSESPFIILKVTNFDTAFAGMLAWEQTMSADLSPLFGPVVRESFDPTARTDTQVRNAFFKDVIASNLSARLLIDENGEERIVYTFIDKNTILITTSREVIPEILPLVRQ